MAGHLKILLMALVLLAGACVVPFELKVPRNNKYLVVEATLNDIDVAQTISINETNNYADNTYNTPVTGLHVEIIIDGAEKINLTEQKAGVYGLPFDFRIQPGTTYKLRFEKPDGTVYESSDEKTTKVPAIDRIFDEFELTGLEGEFRDLPANYVYIDFKDNAETTDFYLWTWRLWENQVICKTDYYDYYCNSKCWEIVRNKDFNVFSDIYSKGKPVSGKLVAKIPYYSFDGALLEIRQQAVSEQVYKYFKLVSDQMQTTGTLVDTPPAAIIGNVKNINNHTEAVAGVFSVTSTVKQKYWLDRKNGLDKAIPVGLLGRAPNTQSLPISYPCIDGPTRTPNKPDGWIE